MPPDLARCKATTQNRKNEIALCSNGLLSSTDVYVSIHDQKSLLASKVCLGFFHGS